MQLQLKISTIECVTYKDNLNFISALKSQKSYGLFIFALQAHPEANNSTKGFPRASSYLEDMKWKC